MHKRVVCYNEPTYSQKQNDMQTKKQIRLSLAGFWRARKQTASWQDQTLDARHMLQDYSRPDTRAVIVRKKLVRPSIKLFGLSASLVLLAAGSFAWQTYSQANQVFQGQSSFAAAKTIPLVPQILKGEAEGRVNVLILGAPGEGKPGGDLTDVMLIVSVDPVNHTVKTINIPKDMWVSMPTPYYGAKQKINVAFAAGKYQKLGRADLNDMSRESMEAGFAATDRVLADTLGVTIHYHLYMNSTAFEKAIDSVGGVELDIKRRLYDPMLAADNAKSSLILPAGAQVVSGKKALLYARSQAAWGDSRAERQQQVLAALKQKVLSLGTLSNPAKLQQLMTVLGSNVYSDMRLQDAFRLYGMVRDAAPDSSTLIDLASSGHFVTDKVNNAQVLRPKAGQDSFAALVGYVGAQLPDGVLAKEATKVTVFAPTRQRAITAAQELRRQGYIVTESVQPGPNTQVQNGTVQLVDLSAGKAAYASKYLSQKYGVPVGQAMPAHIAVPTGTEFAIILF